MEVPRGVRWLLRIGSGITLAFLYAPLIVIAIYAFNKTRVQTWPPTGLTTDWFHKAAHNAGHNVKQPVNAVACTQLQDGTPIAITGGNGEVMIWPIADPHSVSSRCAVSESVPYEISTSCVMS